MPLFTRFHSRSVPSALLACVGAIALAGVARDSFAQKPQLRKPRVVLESEQTPPLRFSFEGAPWREVIRWLADEANLALHVGDLPTGSFTYSDPNTFTHQEAIDRVNLFLLPQGFTLVRNGQLLTVINLADQRSMQQLDAMAKLVTTEQLANLLDHDVVKCIFPLGQLQAEAAVEELTALQLMTTPAVLAKTNQLIITDTASKLKNVKAILDSFQPRMLDNGTVVKSFVLKHVEAEDVLVVARPHLGLATGEMIGIDVSLSADVQGKNIFVTGVQDKVTLIENLVTAIDKPQTALSTAAGEAELKTYLVAGGNVETIYNVLQTLLAGKEVRLSMDQDADSIVALAAPDVQSEIAQTVTQLQASEAEFEAIPLTTVDPYLVVSLLDEMLDLPDPLFDDPDDIDPDAPKIDADPGNMRLFVRAKRHQIEQIKKIVAELDQNGTAGSSDRIRMLPLKGKQAERLLVTTSKFWRRANPILLFPSSFAEPLRTERVINGQGDSSSAAESPGDTRTLTARYLTDNIRSQEPAIRCQVTPRGLLLQSDDTEALDQFEEQLRTIAGPLDATPSPPIVFYLKYTKPEDAIRMLAELLDGGDAAVEGESGTLVNGYVSSGGSFLGSLVASRQGTTTMTSGTITVVADSRLNRLIAQGTASDIQRIEEYLKIVDKDNSITSVETYGTSHVIELLHTRASDVAATLREAYAGRIVGATGTARSTQSNAQQQPPQRDQAAAKAAAAKSASGSGRGGGESNEQDERNPPAKRTGNNQQVRSLEPKMTIAVHQPSNSLIVTAPEQLFHEVEQLAKLIDSRSEQTFELILSNRGALLQEILQPGGIGNGSRAGNGGSSTPAARPPAARPPAARPAARQAPNRIPVSELLRLKSGR